MKIVKVTVPVGHNTYERTVAFPLVRQETKDKWLNALRSGEYKQGKNALFEREDETYCCLGVLGNCAFNLSRDMMDGSATLHHDFSTVPGYMRPILAGTNQSLQGLCIEMNDTQRMSFAQIADVLELYLPVSE